MEFGRAADPIRKWRQLFRWMPDLYRRHGAAHLAVLPSSQALRRMFNPLHLAVPIGGYEADCLLTSGLMFLLCS